MRGLDLRSHADPLRALPPLDAIRRYREMRLIFEPSGVRLYV
jgi:hypothetical protein